MEYRIIKSDFLSRFTVEPIEYKNTRIVDERKIRHFKFKDGFKTAQDVIECLVNCGFKDVNFTIEGE